MEPEKLTIRHKGQNLQIEYFLRKGNEELTILYLHGLGCSKNDFLEAVNIELLKPYTLVAFDFPGSGNSPYPEEATFGIDDLVGITNIVVSKLNLEKLLIIGHSMGGLVAFRYIQTYPGHVKGFINVEGNLSLEDCFFSRKVAAGSFSEFREVIFKDLKRKLEASTNTGLRTYAQALENVSEHAFYDYSRSLVEHSADAHLIQQFIGLSIPKLFIYGSENDKIPHIPMLKRNGCKVIEIPESNHFPFYDNPQTYYQAVYNFLAQIR